MAERPNPFRTVPQDARRLIGRLLADEGRAHVKSYALAFLFMAVVALSTAGAAYLMKDVINGMVVERDFRALRIIAFVVAGLYLARGLATYGQVVILSRIGNAIIASCQRRVFDKLLAQDIGFFHERRSSDFLTRLTIAANGARDVLQALVTSIGRDILSLIGLVGVMVVQDPVLAGIALLALPIAAATLGKLIRRVRKYAIRSFDGVSRILDTMLEAAQGIRIVKSFGLEDVMRRRMGAAVSDVEKAANKVSAISAMANPLTDTLGGLAVAAVILYGGWRVVVGGETPGEFFSFIAALLLAYEPAKRLGRLHLEIQNGLVGVRLLYEVLDAPPGEPVTPGTPPLKVTAGHVEVKDVAFAYPGRGAALSGIDLEVEPGRTTALVGPSGGGKSTILSLILRFHDPERGIIAIDGQDIAKVDRATLRAAIGYVSQDVYLFRGSIRDNIALGRPGAGEAEIVAAARAAFAHDFITGLTRGYDTDVGELGAQLSGGQRARIAIARAILKDAPILLLDEPTAALDAESEREVQKALDALREGRTTLVVAHRLQTIVNSDRIYVIEEGRVIERGRHAELIEAGGKYAALYAVQESGRAIRA
jgi:ATP-binding cassette subfamily B protein